MIRRISKPGAIRRAVANFIAAIFAVTAASPAAIAQCQGPSDQLGINFNLGFSTLQSANVVSTLRDSQAGWVRVYLYWSYVEPVPGKFNWTAVDQGIDVLRKNNINVLMMVAGPVPCWAYWKSSDGTCNPDHLTVPPAQAWSDFVSAAVKRYAGKVAYWEIWNEPNLVQSIKDSDVATRLAHYRDNILLPGARAVHSADPSAKVVAPAFGAGTGGAENPAKFARLLAYVLTPEVRQQVDVISFHVYPPSDLIAFGNAARQEANQLGMQNAPLWLTETGALANYTPTAPAERVGQQAFMRGKFRQALTSGIYDKIFWFALIDGKNRNDPSANSYGLMDNSSYSAPSWPQRPSFHIFKQFAQAFCRR